MKKVLSIFILTISLLCNVGYTYSYNHGTNISIDISSPTNTDHRLYITKHIKDDKDEVTNTYTNVSPKEARKILFIDTVKMIILTLCLTTVFGLMKYIVDKHS